MQPRRPHGHRAPPRSTTMWPISPAAPRPIQRLPSRIRPAADPGAPEDPEDRLVRLAGAELELGVGGDVDVVGDPHRGAERVARASGPSGKLPSQPGRLRASATSPVCSLESPGEPTPIPASESVCTPAASAASTSASAISRRRPAGRPRSASGVAPRPRPRRPGSTIAAWIFVPPRSMPAAQGAVILPASARVYCAALRTAASSASEWATSAASDHQQHRGDQDQGDDELDLRRRARRALLDPAAALAAQRGRLQVELLGERRAVAARALERRRKRPDLAAGDAPAQRGDRLAQRLPALDLGDRAAELDRQRPAGAAGDLAEPGRRAAAGGGADREQVERVGQRGDEPRRRRRRGAARAARPGRGSRRRRRTSGERDRRAAPGAPGPRRPRPARRRRRRRASRRRPPAARTARRARRARAAPAARAAAAASPSELGAPAASARSSAPRSPAADPLAARAGELPDGREREQDGAAREQRGHRSSTRLRRRIAAKPRAGAPAASPSSVAAAGSRAARRRSRARAARRTAPRRPASRRPAGR